MDPYVLALQLYLFNKACGGLPLRIAEQVVITGVINTTCWTARTIGTGVMWLIRPSTTSRTQTAPQQTNPSKSSNSPNEEISSADQMANSLDSGVFEIITLEQITELEKEITKDKIIY